MPDKKGRAEDADRWVMVHLPRADLKSLEKRRDADRVANNDRISIDAVATRLLVWALEHAPEPLP